MVLARTPDFAPWLRFAIPAAAVVAIAGLALLRHGARGRRAAAVVAVALAFAIAAGPAAYSVATAGRALTATT